jgi:DNA-binding NarL/FixJ family response regulator
MLRAIVVDDEELSAKWLKNVIAGMDEIEVCHTFMNPHDAYEYAKKNPIDLAFLDISMPGMNGMTLSDLLQELDDSIDVVFVTAYEEYAVRAFELSALDYLLKPVTVERLSKTLDKIRRRRKYGETEPSKASINMAEPLTTREKEILHALAVGLSNGEIAARFGIAEATVKTHVFRIYGKLQVKRRGQAISKARQMNLID